MVAERMRNACLLTGIAMLCAANAHAQIFLKPKKIEQEFNTPIKAVGEHNHRNFTETEFNDYMWNFSADTEASDLKARKNVVTSETTPFLSRRSVWSDSTVAQRSAEFGEGKLSYEAAERAMPGDRWAASQLPESDYPGKAQDNEIMAAVYRHFFDYRSKGFAKDSTVYFLGLGPHLTDAPASLLAALQNDPGIKTAGIKIKPASRALEITDDGIRDRDSGAYGPVFRVDDIGPVKDGEVHVIATYSERDGFWFTRDFTLRQGKTGWEVVKDSDYAMN